MPDLREFPQALILAFGGKLRHILTVHQRVTDGERRGAAEDRTLLGELNRLPQRATEASEPPLGRVADLRASIALRRSFMREPRVRS